MTKDMGREKHTCECHKIIGGRVTCNMVCLKCSKAKEIRTTERNGYKKIEVIF